MLVPLKADVGISDDLRHVLIVFLLGVGGPQEPPKGCNRAPNDSKWTTKCFLRSHSRQNKEYDLNYIINVLDKIVTTHERPPQVPNAGSMRSQDIKFYYGKS